MKKISIILLLSCATIQSFACDVCGCSLGGNYYGILPQFNKNFIGLRWSQASFFTRLNRGSQYLHEEYSHDTYSRAELMGRYYLTKRIQLFAFMPFNYNYMHGSDQTVYHQGLSDMTITANYLLINTGDDKTRRFKHTLLAGGGIKLPTGKSNLQDNGKLVNPNFQMGTGSTDFLLSTIYTIRYQKFGLMTEAGYKINTRNREEYRFGNQFHASSQVFFWQNIKSFSVLPNAGVYYEQAQQHWDGDIIKTNTGGSSVLAALGIETYFRRMTVGINYKHPLSQKFNTDETAIISGKDRWTLSFTYNF